MPPTVVISSRGEQRIRSGHPWVYAADVVEARAEGGEIVEVIGPRRRTVGYALYSDRSQISIRMLTQGEVAADSELLRLRIHNAVRFRDSLNLDATAYRALADSAEAALAAGPSTAR